jgi:hypothetical protein
MVESQEGSITAKFPKGITVTLVLPWFEVLGEVWKVGKKLIRGLASEGIYEMLDYESHSSCWMVKGRKHPSRKR